MATEIPTLPGTTEALGQLATQSGLLGILLSIALGAISVLFWLYVGERKYREATIKAIRDQYDEELRSWERRYIELQETRIREGRESLAAIATNTAAMTELQRSVSERSNTSQQLTELMRTEANLSATSRESFKALGARLEAVAGDNSKKLEQILRSLPRSGGGPP